ncbi:hypothetical protein F2Q70_00027470 [Brassica cretica]|uniref:Uncharacterized protein n=1 Tax=Brassica cretica TaxID=69181 RepID=A0A8S9LF77_BRACR|nr:hypothetical protein F2Q70_00027470 [Brassica cretica]
MQILGLRLADGEKIPSLGFIYGELLVAKNSIKETTDHLEKNYQPIFKIIDEKMKGWLDSPLHMASYVLNPFYFYKDNIQCDLEVMDGSITCVETFYHGDFEKQGLVVNHEVNLYKNRNGSFGRNLAMTGCEKKENFDPKDEDIVDMKFESDVFQEDPIFHDSQPLQQ